jgi:putative DNA primase/helicase
MGGAAMTNAKQIGIALKGRRNGDGWLVRCPCPNHGKGRGDRFPSLSVADGDDGRLLLRCFAGCDFADVLGELKRRGLADSRQSTPLPRFTPSVHRFAEPSADVGALAIWQATVEAHETFVDEYLNRRGIYLRPSMLRCRLDRKSMVVGVQAPDGKIIAIQQTWLTPDGEKASPKRLTTGNLGTGAVRLGAPARIMGLAEGVETALSAMQMTGGTVGASLGSTRLHSVELPTEVEEVHIFVDNDEPGRTGARRAADIHTSIGRKVYLRSPPDQCGDWNDFLNLIADRDGRDLPPSEAKEDAA